MYFKKIIKIIMFKKVYFKQKIMIYLLLLISAVLLWVISNVLIVVLPSKFLQRRPANCLLLDDNIVTSTSIDNLPITNKSHLVEVLLSMEGTRCETLKESFYASMIFSTASCSMKDQERKI